MSFPVTITGSMFGVLQLAYLKHSDGLELYATSGVSISWLTDTRFQIVLPSNENIGTQWLLVCPNYYNLLFTQTEILPLANYELEYQMPHLGRVVYGYIYETVSHEQLLADSITVTPGSHTVVLPPYISNVYPYYAIITTPGEYVFEYIKNGYSVAQKTVVVEEWKGCYEGQSTPNCYAPSHIHVDANLTLLSGQYYGSIDGTVGISYTKDWEIIPNVGVVVEAVSNSSAGTAKTKTDDKGKFYFHLPVGLYIVKFHKHGYESASIPITITAGVTTEHRQWLSEKYSVIKGTIRYLGPYDNTFPVTIALIKEGEDKSRARRIYLPATETEFRFEDIDKPGRYKIIALLFVPLSDNLYGKVPYFRIELNEKKRVLLELSSKVSGYYPDIINKEEIGIIDTAPSCNYARANSPFVGVSSRLTTITSL